MLINDINGFGRIELTSLPLAADIHILSSTYLPGGNVMVFFNTPQDQTIRDYYNIATVNDDGSGFKIIYSGLIPQHKKANGIRHMPFEDNKRVLLGDYVLEAQPDLRDCQSAQLIPVQYPKIIEDDPRTSHHWSEIIIAPDNVHLAWTALIGRGASVFLGKMQRQESCYTIENVQRISTDEVYLEKDGYLIPQPVFGGEVKQFVHGGTAISLVGAKHSVLPDSVVQHLNKAASTQVTFMPGYEETTMFSPDEQLGVVMSTRFSPKTNFAILGLLPRPEGVNIFHGLAMPVYMYAVAAVRTCRKGNIGPALIDIEKSMRQSGYQGVALHDPAQEWVYLSPLSWHPSSQKAMWNEQLRGTQTRRIRIAHLMDYEPGEKVAVQVTPDDVPYGKTELMHQSAPLLKGTLKGQQGFVHINNGEAVYENYSDDGLHVYNGFERVVYLADQSIRYEADLALQGEKSGEMKLRLTFAPIDFKKPVTLSFDILPDGKPASYGYAQYEGTCLTVEAMQE